MLVYCGEIVAIALLALGVMASSRFNTVWEYFHILAKAAQPYNHSDLTTVLYSTCLDLLLTCI
jgi:hypothetical protein